MGDRMILTDAVSSLFVDKTEHRKAHFKSRNNNS